MKIRLDNAVTEQGHFESRERARIAIMEGLVYVNGQKEDKPGTMIDDKAVLEIRQHTQKYVSRGGYKLEKAMEIWPITLTGKVSMDVGASTGGFTDCMLQNGASRVYAVDCGYGQLAWSLRQDERVLNLEKTNARYLTEKEVPEAVDFSSIDVSFISLTKILPSVYSRLTENGEVVALIKPQFEAGREKVGKKGVVRDLDTHFSVCRNVLNFASSIGFSILGFTYSPIKGPEGNIEYLVYLRKEAPSENSVTEEMIHQIIDESHQTLNP